MQSQTKINVFSEIGKLKQVLVHTPGQEIDNINPNELDRLLFSAYLEPNKARQEHQAFCHLLKDQGVEVVQLKDLFLATWKQVDEQTRDQGLNQFVDQIGLKDKKLKPVIKTYLLSLKPKQMVEKMIAGIFSSDLGLTIKGNPFVSDPMPNLYFTRDPWAAIGNGVTLNAMKYPVRKRENFFSDFIFTHHRDYQNVIRYFDHNDQAAKLCTLEGGDIFVYNDKTLVIGLSERTTFDAITLFATNLIEQKSGFEKIFAIKVPPMPNLMHLDTWLTMVDHNKFLYSPNMLKTLEYQVFEINGDQVLINKPVKNVDLKTVLKTIINQEPVLIPVGGENATQLTIDIETHFDATNFLVIKPGVVIGYDRNQATIKALKANGIKVIGFNGDQLSLGMGSARCMSMPLIRQNLKGGK